METIFALKIHEKDNVATVFSNEAVRKSTVQIKDRAGRPGTIQLRADIPYGHKVALQRLRAGEKIIKYGEEIGIASVGIEAGDYVHIHNLESQRGRGDLERAGK